MSKDGEEDIDPEAFERFQEGGLRVVGELVACHKKRKPSNREGRDD